MPKRTGLEIPAEEQAQMLAALRRARYGFLLALQTVLWYAAGRHPTDIAAVLYCSRSSVYRTVRAYQEGTLGLEHVSHRAILPTGHQQSCPGIAGNDAQSSAIVH